MLLVNIHIVDWCMNTQLAVPVALVPPEEELVEVKVSAAEGGSGSV